MSTIKKVAADCGVSTATVSYVINNGPRHVKPETRQRVLQSIHALNYHPSAIARGLNKKTLGTIGVVAIDPIHKSPLSDPYFNAVIGGILDGAADLGQSVMLFNGPVWTNSEYAVPIFCDGRCDGLILLVTPIHNRILDELKQRNTAFLVLGEGSDDPDISSIDIENIEAAQRIVTYLIEQGHRRIAHFEGKSYFQSSIDRRQGYRLALENAGITYDPTIVFPGDYTLSSGYDRAVKDLSHLPDLPTALFCANDYVAFGAIKGLREMGVKVPDQISVVGIDGIDPGYNQGFCLTTIEQDLESLGKSAVGLLQQLISSNEKILLKETKDVRLRIGDTVTSINP